MSGDREKWSYDRLERSCRRLLLERTSLKVGALKHAAADVEWTEPDGRARVRVDNHDVGLRPGVLHELLHVALDEPLAPFDEELGELIVLAFEARLDARIARSKRRTAWWRKAITKLAK